MKWEVVKRNQKYIKAWAFYASGPLVASLFEPGISHILNTCRSFVVNWWVHRGGLWGLTWAVLWGLGGAAYCYAKDQKDEEKRKEAEETKRGVGLRISQ